jgi:hypothetical protein
MAKVVNIELISEDIVKGVRWLWCGGGVRSCRKKSKKEGKISVVVQNSVVSGSTPGKAVAIPRDVS